ncbi:Uncharacterised protein [Mycobacteroides abscessus subsp. abscessus]|uniref:hypothetical protein n=1 Tax=Mycobacteroides abscessus TaxID=36809 RepID=UPI0009275CFA|nr:hypothetical protein [Mycobacteroides abscessus]SIH23346.1 Uncharacterised protein [Mycobacteroides abscessus subsp. abscessus]
MSGHVMDEDEVYDFLNNEDRDWVLRVAGSHVAGWLKSSDIPVTEPVVAHLRTLLQEVTLRGSVSESDIIDALDAKLQDLTGKDLEQYIEALPDSVCDSPR